ncbi:MAG TPA: creatininase family protein [Polyangiaceae bacterium]
MKTSSARGVVTGIVVAASLAPLALAARRDDAAHSGKRPGVLLEDVTWMDAEKLLGPDTVVVLPIGAASKEHGPHLRLSNDWLLADAFRRRLAEVRPVVVAPIVGYNFYPAFGAYPGSTTLRLETARDLVVDVCRSLARYGPRRFYALNTGLSTVRALEPAAKELAGEGILLRYTDWSAALRETEQAVCQQTAGTHADETETSLTLAVAPGSVDMSKAVRDIHEHQPGGLVRSPDEPGTYSPTGCYGDATLATREKGEKLAAALMTALERDVDDLRTAPLPRP